MQNRKIPVTMATQHPDHGATPYWHNQPFISTQDEALEAFLAFSELGIDEYKWDWEGKLVDESVLERFFGEHFDFFKQYPLGQERFLTFRLPNAKVETEFRVGRAFMNLASAASVAKHFGLPTPPLFEVILPMTETPEEILALQVAYQEMHKLKHPLYRLESILTNLRVIPLFEQVQTIINSDKILEKYFSLYQKEFKKLPPYFRPYVARSDPALNSGLIATVLAIKIALSRFSTLEKQLEIPMFPIIGAAALPFRGGISPLTVDSFANEYKGIKTTTIQSAFRYDFEKEVVIKAIAKLKNLFSQNKSVVISKREEKHLLKIINLSEAYYRKTIEEIAPTVNSIASHFPKRRERVQHIGLFGYSRGVGKVTLPRAITFTGSLYSIGIPPEIIGTGRAIRQIRKQGNIEFLEKYYINIKSDLLRAGAFLNTEVLHNLSKSSPGWDEVATDVKEIEKYLKISLGPNTEREKEHYNLSQKIYTYIQKGIPSKELIEQAAILRKSLG